METISAILGLFSIIAFILGMIKPKWVIWFGITPKRKTVAFIYLGLFILAVILSTKSTKNNEPKTIAEPIIETVEENNSNEIISSIGKEIKVGYFSYFVNSIEYRKTVGNEFSSETADGIFLLVNLSIINTSDETQTLDGSAFFLTDKNDVKFEHSLEMSGIETLFLKECQPRIKTKGVLIFEVPEKGSYSLNLVGDFLGTTTVKILLK